MGSGIQGGTPEGGAETIRQSGVKSDPERAMGTAGGQSRTDSKGKSGLQNRKEKNGECQVEKMEKGGRSRT